MRASRAIALASVSCAIALGGEARAQPKTAADTSKADSADARTLFEDGDYDGAYVKFLAAYEKSHAVRFLWDLAVCEKNLRRYASALRLIDRYRDEGRGVLRADDRAEAAALVAAIEPFTARVRIVVNEPGAEVSLDGESLGTSPLASPVVVDLGVRALRVTKAGFRPYVASVPIGGSKEATIEAKLERAGGHLKVDAPPQATVAIDGRELGRGTIDVDLRSGGHTVRVTAPRLQTFQTEVVLRDDQARTLTVSLEKEIAERKSGPEVLVAVGCMVPEPVAPEQGLRVRFDQDTASQPISEVRRRWDNARQRDVVAWATYPIDPGSHIVRVSAPNCESATTTVDVAADRPARVTGVLAPRTSFIFRGPAGTPNGTRFALGVWAGATRYDGYWQFATRNGVRLLAPPTRSVAFAGPMLTYALASPFITVAFDGRLGFAHTTGSALGVDTQSQAPHPIDGDTNATRMELAARFGPRLPLYYASISGGGEVALANEWVAPRAYESSSGSHLSASWWLAVDAQPVCDFNVELMVARARLTGVGDPTTSDLFSIGVGYQPNEACKRARGVRFGIHAEPR